MLLASHSLALSLQTSYEIISVPLVEFDHRLFSKIKAHFILLLTFTLYLIVQIFPVYTYPIFHTANLALPMLRLFCPKHKDAKTFENHLNPVMLVLIGKPSQSTLR